MSSSRPFRFGVVAAQARSAEEWMEKARQVEDLGYATLVIPDTLQYSLSPFTALALAAAVTQTLRLGTYVLANDLRHPVLLAKDAATLDLLSGGRFELGLGAGRPAAEADNRAMGLPFDSGSVRVGRLEESLAIIKGLLAGEHVSAAGRYYSVTDAAIAPLPVQKPLPVLVAGSGRRLLTVAAQQADIVALGIPPNASEAMVAEKIDWLREAAGPRFDDLEINLNLMAVAGRLPRYLTTSLGAGAAAFAESDAIPVLKGSVDAMCERLRYLRETLGISYFMAGDELMDALAPVVSHMAGK